MPWPDGEPFWFESYSSPSPQFGEDLPVSEGWPEVPEGFDFELWRDRERY